MQIFIDESGNFEILDQRRPHVCCVAAMVVAGGRVDALLRDFVSLRETWGGGHGEVKGSKLDERQVSQSIEVAIAHDVLLEVCAADTGRHSIAQVVAARADQAGKLRAGVGDQHHPTLVREIHEMAAQWERLSPQLVVQLYTTVHVVAQVIDHAPTYFAQRIPAELAEFGWILDRKDIQQTPYETLWTQMVCPFLQSMSLVNPFTRIEGFDYSHMDAFRIDFDQFPHLQEELEAARNAIGPGQRAREDAIDVVKLVRRNTSFEDSARHPGLQLVDLLANAFTRAMNDRLGREGWQNLGRLMIYQASQPPAPFIEIAVQSNEPQRTISGRQDRIMKLLQARPKSMLV